MGGFVMDRQAVARCILRMQVMYREMHETCAEDAMGRWAKRDYLNLIDLTWGRLRD